MQTSSGSPSTLPDSSTLPPTPGLPHTTHLVTQQEVENIVVRSINEALNAQTTNNVKKRRLMIFEAVGIGVGGFLGGIGSTLLIGKILRSRRARAASSTK